MTTPIRSWLDNAILQSVAESYLNLIDAMQATGSGLAFCHT